MLFPSLLLLGNCLALAPAPQAPLNLPEAEGEAEWYGQHTGRTDLYGDPLPEGAVARIGSARFRFGDTPLAIAYSPDGRTLAVAGHEGVHLLDASSGKLVARFSARNTGGFNQVAFLLGGRYLAAQSHTERIPANRILIWKRTPGASRPLQGPEVDRSSRFAVSSDGKHLVFVKDQTIHLWDIHKEKEFVRLPGRVSASRLSLSSDGKLLAALDAEGIALWDVPARKSLRHISPTQAGEEANRPRRPRDPVLTGLALSGDSKVLAGFLRFNSGKHVIRIWETASGNELQTLSATEQPGSMVFSPDGHYLALTGGHQFQVWDVRTGKVCWQIPMWGNTFWSICFSPDGRFVAVGLTGIVRVWETATGRERCPFPELRDVRHFSLSPDGRTVVTSELLVRAAADTYEPSRQEGDLRYWDAASGNRLLPPQGSKKRFPLFAALSRDQRTLATWGPEKLVQLWDPDSGKKVSQIPCEEEPEVKVLSDDGKLLALGFRSSTGPGKMTVRLTLWDARTGKQLGELKEHQGFFIDVRFSPDGKVLASIGEGYTLHLWDTATQKELHRVKPGPKTALYHLAFSRDGRIVAVAGQPAEIRLVEVSSGKEIGKIAAGEQSPPQPRSWVTALLFSADGKRLFTANTSGKVFLWDRESGRLVKEWQAETCGVSEMAISSDGKVLMTKGGFTALIWDLDRLLK